jgi:hypothetical protein
MKDDFRWYNTALFNDREEYLKKFPELEPQIYNNKGLRPFLSDEELQSRGLTKGTFSKPEAACNKTGAEEGNVQFNVCCPQGIG